MVIKIGWPEELVRKYNSLQHKSTSMQLLCLLASRISLIKLDIIIFTPLYVYSWLTKDMLFNCSSLVRTCFSACLIAFVIGVGLQEHHFEIWTRAVAYIDLSRILQGNQTLHVFSSPLLREVARKAIQKVKHLDSITPPDSAGSGRGSLSPGIVFSSTLTCHEPAFAFFGNLGIPFLRLTVSNNPKVPTASLYSIIL
jgi:hypothetical protein